MDVAAIRNDIIFQALAAAILGVALDNMIGVARGLTAPLLIDYANWLIETGDSMNTSRDVILNSAHAFISAVPASIIGLVTLSLAFNIRSMLLPMITCIAFILTTYWWFISNFPEVLHSSTSEYLLVLIVGHTSAIITWLFISFIWVKWVMPNNWLKHAPSCSRDHAPP